MKKINKSGYTIIELLVSTVILAFVMLIGMQAFLSLTIGRNKLANTTKLQEDIFYFTENLFDKIKSGGVIDHEMYFERKIRNGTTTADSNKYENGHFKQVPGFGNYGKGKKPGDATFGDYLFYCQNISLAGGGNGCLNSANNFLNGTNSASGRNLSLAENVSGRNDGVISGMGSHLRYMQYRYQFLDFDSDGDGMEYGSTNLIGDNDDIDTGLGPNSFEGEPIELYLISADGKKRIFFRWKVKLDPNTITGTNCIGLNGNPKDVSGDGCLGTIEYLELDGYDFGEAHNKSGTTYGDGIIDTWLYAEELTGFNPDSIVTGNNTWMTGNLAGRSLTEYEKRWIPLFSEDINVQSFKLAVMQNKNYDYAWKSPVSEIVAPYIRISIKVGPSWKAKKQMQLQDFEMNFSTTIALNDILRK